MRFTLAKPPFTLANPCFTLANNLLLKTLGNSFKKLIHSLKLFVTFATVQFLLSGWMQKVHVPTALLFLIT